LFTRRKRAEARAPGYRLYVTQRGNTVVILLCGGDKTTRRFDAVNYLKTRDNIAGYLDAVLEDGDPESLKLALDEVARTPIAKEAGLPPLLTMWSGR
jgi:hypothetical protein